MIKSKQKLKQELNYPIDNTDLEIEELVRLTYEKADLDKRIIKLKRKLRLI